MPTSQLGLSSRLSDRTLSCNCNSWLSYISINGYRLTSLQTIHINPLQVISIESPGKYLSRCNINETILWLRQLLIRNRYTVDTINLSTPILEVTLGKELVP